VRSSLHWQNKLFGLLIGIINPAKLKFPACLALRRFLSSTAS
jgi:hypothetical protein